MLPAKRDGRFHQLRPKGCVQHRQTDLTPQIGIAQAQETQRLMLQPIAEEAARQNSRSEAASNQVDDGVLAVHFHKYVRCDGGLTEKSVQVTSCGRSLVVKDQRQLTQILRS